MNTFNLADDCLVNPTRFDVAAVKFMMLWPDDPVMRQAAMDATLLEEGEPLIDDMALDIARRYARAARSCPTLRMIESALGDRPRHGAVAGRITLKAIFLNQAGRAASIQSLREEVCEDLRREGVQIRPQTIANKSGPVAKFRSVSHLWAAYVHQYSNGDRIFPCVPKDIELFLGLAEAIRILGESTFTAHSKTPIIVPGETVMLPATVIPAEVAVDFVAPPSATETEAQIR